MTNVCLVTGGAGFIGCAIVERLVSQFDRVVVVDNLHPQVHAGASGCRRLDKNATLIVADVAVDATWPEVFETYHPDVIVHLAAETGTGQSLLEASRHAWVNVLGLARMLDAAANTKRLPKRVVLASSRAVYGEGAWRDPRSGVVTYPRQRTIEMLNAQQWDPEGLVSMPFSASETRCEPISVYASTKLAQEHILRSWCASLQVDAFIPRLQNVYGPGQSLTNSYTGIVPIFAQIAKAEQSIPVYEDGNILRDFVFIDDVADALAIFACDSNIVPGIYDVGSGVATSILHLANLLAAQYGAPRPTISGQYRPGDVRHASCVMDRTTTALGWTPKVSLETGLRVLCDWMQAST